MYSPDANHQKMWLMQTKLSELQVNLASLLQATTALDMLILSRSLGYENDLLTLLEKDKLTSKTKIDYEAAREHVASLIMDLTSLRESIPNTTPPDPRGFESALKSDSKVTEILEGLESSETSQQNNSKVE